MIAGLTEEVNAGAKPAEGRVNPKRLARQASRELQARGASTIAQAALQLEYEKRKKERHLRNRLRTEEAREAKWEAKIAKAKNKHRGR
ncbi:DUF2992 family protein [Cohnella candidum]|uniref:DUF2992 family protein n=1 Tax=Cohnella candidum TaxID=2674991 RepID=A0A3G3JZV8_9BACL|nr:DUF2992 family protein [Cohnella candidum]AYQ73407.1 DUF2992 family protein [Cohnella candidum]